MGRVVGLFRLTFRDPSVVLDKVKGEPVYLILSMTRGQADPHETAESGHRPADPSSGGGWLTRGRAQSIIACNMALSNHD